MMTQKFLDAIEAGNLISVRYSLTNELLLDPRGDSYREMKVLAEERLEGLYEALDGKLSEKPAEEYTEAELMELKNDLDANFSRERLAHYEQVVAVVLREKAGKICSYSGRSSLWNSQVSCRRDSNYSCHYCHRSGTGCRSCS